MRANIAQGARCVTWYLSSHGQVKITRFFSVLSIVKIEFSNPNGKRNTLALLLDPFFGSMLDQYVYLVVSDNTSTDIGL